ncbi:hypothetical protein K8R66_03600 [bacterium]|nr:hypothetical protein [bacterium]
MSFATLLSWFGFLMVIFFTNPAEAGILSFAIFYLILALAVIGTFTILGFLIRRLFSKEELAFPHVIISFRQALWLALVLDISLYLQSISLFNWLNAILIILVLGLIEFFCLNYQAEGKINNKIIE